MTSWPKSTLRERSVMARSSELKATKDHQPAEAPVPSWQKDSVDRSLRNARARAQARSDRFVAAAIELLGERDESDFTIQDVVDKSNMSQRTFYTFFDGKDSLLLAVYETILRTTAMPMIRERCEGIADPVLRVRALMEALSEITAMPARLARGLSVLHLRLAESRPNDLAYALEPLHSFIVELLEEVADAGLLRDDVPLATQAALLQELLLATSHSAVLSGGRSTSVDDLWAFCSAAILRVAT
ncbi:TetR/AcrR family transcriptional regulator [Mycobacterium intracellulare]|uniref:TetR/AcrR family transcriptional regulator n=2 Tax=Mycobacteriaceae TaxID=1762 RepID=UPI001CDA017C|nr:helix-turn-helix domain-containing protein [Mycobacterium intracellulare]UGU02816.1 TetR/AcrR family transcriptional regulator [Mycobacterium intracellulare]